MGQLSSTPFSLLDLASVPLGYSISETFKRMQRHAQRADELGMYRYWLAEHHNMEGIASSATSVLIGSIANATKQIRVGSGGIMLPNHPPLVIAEQFGTLDALHPGRIDLGLGRAPGTDSITSQALRRGPVGAEQFPQDVQELQRLLGKENHSSKVRAYPGGHSDVSIWLLGSSLYSAQLAAEKGLPYAFAGHFAPRLAEQAIKLYASMFQPSQQLDKPYAMLCLPLVLAEHQDEAEYLATSTFQRVLSLLRGAPLYLPEPKPLNEIEWSAMERAHVQEFLSLAVIGNKEYARAKLEQFVEQLPVQELMFTNDIFDEEKRLSALEILSQL